ncbi:MAG TPA: 3'-5' exonuclease [Candidatus Krumholzibacteria bacterium]|nr:3'-5' exonuclease [Candidatus Krumholzibacteria bacterium]HPD72992.1 3'-5' exonuclease [Candidatus Krumholzibacteria bacterium]HRY41791.1 3'-5' exonuclease [Candidatus Krumholzibacteria bacterium]
MQNLQLDRPLVCFDLETTGTDPAKDRIVQIALVRVEPDGGRRTFTTLVNPQRPIPAEATAVHGIRDEHVRAAPSFSQIRAEVEEFLAGADLVGFNALNFDLPLLEAEIRREGGAFQARGRRLLDAMVIFHRKEPRNLVAAVRFYCGRELAGAHSAEADALATLDVLDAQLARYPDLPRDADGLHAFCNRGQERFVDRGRKFRWNDQGDAVFAFGKHEGKSLRDMARNQQDRGYLEWMLGKDFSEEVKGILRDALAGTYPVRQ